MFRTFAGLAFASAALTAPALAQGRETEFGVDMAIKWMAPSGGGSGVFHIQTPVDLRVAFHTGGNVAIEPRLTAVFLATSGASIFTADPGLNVLVDVSGDAHNNGAYFTVGADLSVTGGTGMSGTSIYSFNAGLGLRRLLRPAGKTAGRGELFVGYTPKQGTEVMAGTFTVGARLGLSFFN